MANVQPPPIICLCGSTKFKDRFLKLNALFTLKGWVVVTVGMFGHADSVKLSRENKAVVDVLHFAKIDMAEVVYIINTNGYIGESTEREIAYARMRGKQIVYDEPGSPAG